MLALEKKSSCSKFSLSFPRSAVQQLLQLPRAPSLQPDRLLTRLFFSASVQIGAWVLADGRSGTVGSFLPSEEVLHVFLISNSLLSSLASILRTGVRLFMGVDGRLEATHLGLEIIFSVVSVHMVLNGFLHLELRLRLGLLRLVLIPSVLWFLQKLAFPLVA